MKKRILTILAIASLVCFSMYAKEIKVKDQVRSFVEGMKHGTVKAHKSVNMDNKAGDDIILEKAFEGNFLMEYEILASDKAANNISKQLTKKFGKNSYTAKVNAEDSTLVVNRSKPGKSASIKAKDLNLAAYEAKAREILANFSELAGSVEYNSYTIDKQQRISGGNNAGSDEEVTLVTLNFTRVFKGASIRNMVSYVNVMLNAAGELDALTVVWPEFKATGKSKMTVSVDTPLEKIVDNYKTLDSAMKEGEEVSVETIDIIGLEKTWIEVVADGKMLITPAHTVVAKISFSDKGSRLKYSDVPLIEEYHQTVAAKVAE